MDSAFYTLIAICIFLLILTFFLAVRRRCQSSRRQVQTRQEEIIMNSDHIQGSTMIDMSILSFPHILRQQLQNSSSRPLLLLSSTSPILEHSIRTSWIQPSSIAAYKPEEQLPSPPPSYQDYPKDIRLLL